MTSRRFFMKSAALGVAGSLARLNALAAGEDYRALVCVFLFGGNDANNMLVPLDDKGYQAYSNVRKTLALAQADLLPVQASAGAFGLHPLMPELQKLYGAKRLALLANTGNLVRPITRAQYQEGQDAPENLFSHLDQQNQWQSGAVDGYATTGWGGRVADRMAGVNGPATFPMLVSVAGNSLYGTGEETMPATVIPGAALGLRGYDTGALAAARYRGLQELISFSSGATLVGAANSTLSKGLTDSELLNKALDGAAALQTQFPAGNSLATQLQQVARIIQVRSHLGMSRQIFFCSLGGFDTHVNQLNDQGRLLGQVSAALAAFYQATEELGVAQSVTAFTHSDFARTFQPNSTAGSDHAWGSHHLILGGAVRGGEMYGRYPTLELGGPDDAASEGRWIPTVATDQYAATLATWFGLPDAKLAEVFPVLGNFSQRNLGFV